MNISPDARSLTLKKMGPAKVGWCFCLISNIIAGGYTRSAGMQNRYNATHSKENHKIMRKKNDLSCLHIRVDNSIIFSRYMTMHPCSLFPSALFVWCVPASVFIATTLYCDNICVYSIENLLSLLQQMLKSSQILLANDS